MSRLGPRIVYTFNGDHVAQCVSFTNALVKERPSADTFGIAAPNITKMLKLNDDVSGKQNKTIVAKFIFDCVLVAAKTMDPTIESHCRFRNVVLNKIREFSLVDTSFLEYERLFRRRTAKFDATLTASRPDNVPPEWAQVSRRLVF